MKIQELFPLIPQGLFHFQEAAGTILRQEREDQVAVEDLLVMPLLCLLLELTHETKNNKQTCSLITTAQDHTVCYVADELGQLFVFDPLPASLCSLPLTLPELQQWLQWKYSTQKGEPLYSALLRKKHSVPEQ